MGMRGLGLLLAILLSRVALAFLLGETADEPDLEVEDAQQDCGFWANFFSVGDCKDSVSSFATIAFGVIPGMPVTLNVVQSIVQTMVVIWSIRDFVGAT